MEGRFRPGQILTMRDVAARVGLKASSLYSYFDGKSAIYDAMFAQGARAELATHADWDHLLGRYAFPEASIGCGETTAARLAACCCPGRRPPRAASPTSPWAPARSAGCSGCRCIRDGRMRRRSWPC